MWESINRAYLDLRNWDIDKVMAVSPHEFFAWVKNASHLFQGIMNRTLMMGESRDFLDMGRFLERADQAARILDVKYHDLLPRYLSSQAISNDSQFQSVISFEEATEAEKLLVGDPIGVGGPVDIHGWIAVLKSVGAYEAFRKTHFQVTPGNVVEFLILNSQFPASVRHSIGRVDGCLRRVSGNFGTAPSNDAERSVGKLYSTLNFMTSKEIIDMGLHEFLQDVQTRCLEIGNAITSVYLLY